MFFTVTTRDSLLTVSKELNLSFFSILLSTAALQKHKSICIYGHWIKRLIADLVQTVSVICGEIIS